MEDFDAPTQGLGEAGRADGHDHELLEVDVVIGMGAAVEDVHHGHRESVGAPAPEKAVQRESVFGGGGPRYGHGHGEDGVGAEAAFGFGAVKFDHLLIEGALIGGVVVGEGVGDLARDVPDCLLHSFAEITLGVAVAQFDGFVFASRGAAGHDGPANFTRVKMDFRFYRGVAPRVEHFAGGDCTDLHDLVPRWG